VGAARDVLAQRYVPQGLHALVVQECVRQANLWVVAAAPAALFASIGAVLWRRWRQAELPSRVSRPLAAFVTLALALALGRLWRPALWSWGARAQDVALPIVSLLAAGGAAALVRLAPGPRPSVRRLTWGLAAALLLANAGQAWLLARQPASPHVIFLCIDALRPDHLGAYGYARDTSPFLDRLAREGVRFARAYSQESYTQASVASFFTSLSPFTHRALYDAPGVDRLDPSFATLAEILRNAGYTTAAFTFNPHLRSRYGFDQGFERYADHPEGFDPALPPHEAFETARKLRLEVTDYVRRQRGRRLFLYLHYRDVHEPYSPTPPYDRMFGSRGGPERPGAFRRNRFRPEDRQDMLDRYDGEIRYTDDEVAALFQELEALGFLSDSLVVVNADHGEEFWERHGDDPGFWSHGRTLYEELIRVPLILWGRGLPRQGGVVEERVGNIDIFPTLVDLLDLPVVPDLQGRSLLPCLRGEARGCGGDVVSGGNHARVALVAGAWKYYRFNRALQRRRIDIFRRPSPLDPALAEDEELYDLSDDPGERYDRARDQPARLKEMRDKANAHVALAASAGRSDGTPVAADAETLEQLKALGYVQ
jgi:arylsulfatase A-like enzyme